MRPSVARLCARLEIAAKTASREGARLVLAQAAQRAPVRTGRLRGSLAARETARGACVYAACPYAARVEARAPFLAPSAQAAGDDARRAAADALRRALS